MHKIWTTKRKSAQRNQSLTFIAGLQPDLYTCPVYRTHICKFSQKGEQKGGEAVKNSRWLSPLTHWIGPISVSVPKNWCKMREMPWKGVTTNEPPLGGHRLLPLLPMRAQMSSLQCGFDETQQRETIFHWYVYIFQINHNLEWSFFGVF